jgi:drug/metabolite transporter (DMT)-like permease
LIANIAFFIPAYLYQGDDTIARVFADPVLLRDVTMIGVSGALGQIFIYFTISLFNCYLLTVITTTRKLFSVVLSNFSFNHKFTNIQWTGAVLVMACTFYELFMGKKKQ